MSDFSKPKELQKNKNGQVSVFVKYIIFSQKAPITAAADYSLGFVFS